MGYFKKKAKAPPKPAKLKHIDTRFTEDEEKLVRANARECGLPPSTYIHDLAIGHQPKKRMTEGEEEALKGLIGARAEFVYIRNAMKGTNQDTRKKLFNDAELMKVWMDAIDDLTEQLTSIINKFI